ncbi:hypothetical protein [Caldalkalibacillus thermarum]|uniref:hypothetical protein n=1 Tax=Caldalkalibacillus thermarum TaxID=296745 RepID=UPI001668EF8D|nr:hypothetical protein [Caldalkalibacillus thermarum]
MKNDNTEQTAVIFKSLPDGVWIFATMALLVEVLVLIGLVHVAFWLNSLSNFRP